MRMGVPRVHSLLISTEKVKGKGGGVESNFFLLVLWVDEVVTVVFCAAADTTESGETRSGGCVSVDVDHFAALDVLEKSHRRVSCIVLHHSRVVLAFTHVKSWVLKDTSLAISAFRWVFQEVLADRGQVLSAQAFLFLELFLAVGKPATLLLLAVLTGLAVQPEFAKLGLDFFLPAVLHFLGLCAGHQSPTLVHGSLFGRHLAHGGVQIFKLHHVLVLRAAHAVAFV